MIIANKNAWFGYGHAIGNLTLKEFFFGRRSAAASVGIIMLWPSWSKLMEPWLSSLPEWRFRQNFQRDAEKKSYLRYAKFDVMSNITTR